MPFKTLFSSHKKNKQPPEAGVHSPTERQHEASVELPDGGRVMNETRQKKLNKKKSMGKADGGTSIKGKHSKNGNGEARTRGHDGNIGQPPLCRAATAPLPVSSDPNNGSGRCSRRVRKSSSVGASLNASELLHGKRLRELAQLESYISYLRHSPEDESECHMSNRLCCAEILKTLYMRHEQRYVNFLVHNRSPSPPKSRDTPSVDNDSDGSDKLEDPCPDVRDTNLTPPQSELVFTSDNTDGSSDDSDAATSQCTHYLKELRPALKRPSLTSDESISSFCRQKGSRVPVTPRRHGLRVSLSLTPQMISSEERSYPTPQFDPCDCAERDGAIDHYHGSEDNLCDVTNNAIVRSRESRVVESVSSVLDNSRCSSDLTRAPFSTMAVFPGNYEIY